MQQCMQCGAESPDTARTCQRCGSSFQGEAGPAQRPGSLRSGGTTAPQPVPAQKKRKKKQRSLLIGLLALLGIRYDPQKGSWGCALVPAAISAALVSAVVAALVFGPTIKLFPPSNNANFKVNISWQIQQTRGYGPAEGKSTLIVNGGKVCMSEDNGKVQHDSGVLMDKHTPYSGNTTYSCSGTYTYGFISYTETMTSDVETINNKDTCNLLTPGPIMELSGIYTTQGNFSGSLVGHDFPQSAYSCSPDNSSFGGGVGGNGTWKGSIAS